MKRDSEGRSFFFSVVMPVLVVWAGCAVFLFLFRMAIGHTDASLPAATHQVALPTPLPPHACPKVPVEVHFSSECTDVIIELVDSATRVVSVQAYSFTSVPIADALIRAKQRGLLVVALLDRTSSGGEIAARLRQHGVLTLADRRHPIAHNKVVIVDFETVETGSFNFTRQAERNAENCVVIRDGPTAQLFVDEFIEHRAHAEETR